METVLILLLIASIAFMLLTGHSRSGPRPGPWDHPHPGVSVRPEPESPTTPKPVAVPPALHGPAYVIDGDSIRIRKTEIRLFGIDAPEMNHPHGRNAKSALISLCKGHEIRAEITEEDHHGRTVARCYLPDGRDLSAEMVKLGLAIDWPKFSGGAYRSLEPPEVRKKLWLADARQKGRMHVWQRFDAFQKGRASRD